MRFALILLLGLATPYAAAASDRDLTALSAYQAETLKTVGVTPPPADALAIAAILVDRKFEAEEAEKPTTDRIVEGWTSNIFVSEDYGMPCDVANARCVASARKAAGELAPQVMPRFRDLAVLVNAFMLSKRFSVPELATVRAFITTSAGAKIEPMAFTGPPMSEDPRWKDAGKDLTALTDKYHRQFMNETRVLPRAKLPEVRPPKATP